MDDMGVYAVDFCCKGECAGSISKAFTAKKMHMWVESIQTSRQLAVS